MAADPIRTGFRQNASRCCGFLGEQSRVDLLHETEPEVPGEAPLFRAIRVSDTATCAEIIELRDELFPR